jgi:hypothetical protein
MEREFFPEFYFGGINGEAIRSGKKLQPIEPQFVDFNFTTTKQNATKAGTTHRIENTMVVNFSHLPRPANSIDAPFNDAKLGSDMGESSTSMDSMGFQEKEQSKSNKRKGIDASELDFQSKVCGKYFCIIVRNFLTFFLFPAFFYAHK